MNSLLKIFTCFGTGEEHEIERSGNGSTHGQQSSDSFHSGETTTFINKDTNLNNRNNSREMQECISSTTSAADGNDTTSTKISHERDHEKLLTPKRNKTIKKCKKNNILDEIYRDEGVSIVYIPD